MTTIWLLAVTLSWAACSVAAYALVLDGFARENPILYSWRYRAAFFHMEEVTARKGTWPHWRRTRRWARLWALGGPICLVICLLNIRSNGWPLIMEDRGDDWGRVEREREFGSGV